VACAFRTQPAPAAVLLAALAAALATACGGGMRVPDRAERPRPSLEEPLRRLEGDGELRLADLRGKVVLVNFFSSDCLPCVDEVPRLVRVRRDLVDQGFEVVGVALDLYGEVTCRLFTERYGVDYPVVLASRRMFEGETPFGRLSGLPMSVLLDREGAVAGAVLGLVGEERLREAVGALLAEPPP